MNKRQIIRYIIHNFLERNYDLYLNIDGGDFAISRNGVIGSCIIVKTTTSSGRLILDLRGKDKTVLICTNYTYIIGFDVKTKDIWLIPVDDIHDNRTLMLNEKKKHYLLLNRNPDNEPVISEVALKEATLQAVQALNEIDGVKNDEDKQKKAIDTVLERS